MVNSSLQSGGIGKKAPVTPVAVAANLAKYATVYNARPSVTVPHSRLGPKSVFLSFLFKTCSD
jgi:hypothetical protein